MYCIKHRRPIIITDIYIHQGQKLMKEQSEQGWCNGTKRSNKISYNQIGDVITRTIVAASLSYLFYWIYLRIYNDKNKTNTQNTQSCFKTNTLSNKNMLWMRQWHQYYPFNHYLSIFSHWLIIQSFEKHFTCREMVKNLYWFCWLLITNSHLRHL